MRVLGIDQSTRKNGWCVMEHDTMEIVDYGIINLEKEADDSADYLDRILVMRGMLDELIDKYEPTLVIVEDIFMNSWGGKATKGNVETFKKLAKLLGVLEVHMIDNKILFTTIKTGVWRKGLGFGRKRAEQKKRSIELANELYELDLIWVSDHSTKNQDDEADAINITRYGCRIAEEVVKSKGGDI